MWDGGFCLFGATPVVVEQSSRREARDAGAVSEGRIISGMDVDAIAG